MDSFENTTRAFLGVRIAGDLLHRLGELQRTVYDRANHEGRKVQSLPKDALTIPLIDLGETTVESMEAALLAVDRAVLGMPTFSVSLGAPTPWSYDESPALVQLPVTSGIEPLQALRLSLIKELDFYGFPIREGAWSPHVPLSRLRGEGPDFELPGGAPEANLPVGGVALLLRSEDKRGRMRFTTRWERDFASVTNAASATRSDAECRAEIVAQLEERMERRTTLVRPPRRRLRAKDMQDTIDVDVETSDVDAS